MVCVKEEEEEEDVSPSRRGTTNLPYENTTGERFHDETHRRIQGTSCPAWPLGAASSRAPARRLIFGNVFSIMLWLNVGSYVIKCVTDSVVACV